MSNKLWNTYTDYFGLTIFHPQYIINRWKEDSVLLGLKYAQKVKNPTLIDIGCGRMTYRQRFEEMGAVYLGVDHPVISKKYVSGRKPDLLEDVTLGLSLQSGQFDVALLLHSLEYLDSPEKALAESARVLKKRGILILTSPFMYPIHDYPYDKNRFTDVRLVQMIKDAGYKVVKVTRQGGLSDMILLSTLIACFKTAQKLIQNKRVSIKLLGVLSLVALILMTVPLNLVALFLELFINPRGSDFTINFTVVAQKI